MIEFRKSYRPGRQRAAGAILLAVLYVLAAFAEFLSPNDYREQSRREPSAPPSVIHLRDAAGEWHFRPFIHARRMTDPMSRSYEEITDRKFRVEFFPRGASYELFGIFVWDRHLAGIAGDPETDPRLYLLGTDELGRDRFARLLSAIRFSLLVTPAGALLAWLIGILVGVTSGYAGRTADSALMGVADAMISLPTLILILAARAAFPIELPPLTAAALLIGIFALTGWAEIARLARGLVVSMKQREFVLAAKSIGLTESRILFRHIFPNISRPLVTQMTVMLPAFLLAETALSFLGVGLQEPEPSLGNMLTAAADISQLRQQPIVLLMPAFVIFVFVLAVRLVGSRREAGSTALRKASIRFAAAPETAKT